MPLVEDDSGLDGRLVPHCLQALGPLLDLESLVYNTLNLDLAALEIINGVRAVRLLAYAASFGTAETHNLYVSEKEPRMVISSPKILDGGHETRASLLYTPYTTSLPPRRT